MTARTCDIVCSGQMKRRIHRIRLGICNCYLIEQDGLILIDAGAPKHGARFLKALQRLSVDPRTISLLLLTHGHFDHMGSADEIRGLTGCAVAISRREKDWAEQALRELPPPIGLWGRALESIVKVLTARVRLIGTPVDLALGDEEFSLEAYGISGRVLHTPGHSPGSMSVLLATGEAFVGDLAMNGFPMRAGPGMPVFGEDPAAVKESWRLLLNEGAKWIYPAHGNPFEAHVFERLL